MNTRTAAFPGDLGERNNTLTTADDAHSSEEIVLETSRFSIDAILASVRNIATLSEALRILGAAVILASMSVFLMQGWSAGNDINRYLLLLAQTGLLAGAGFAMSHAVKEPKGARLFFGLALISIPANFTILGALLYSVLQWDSGLAAYPSYAHWEMESLASIGLTMSAALLVLIPVALFAFAVMARHSTRSLTLHFLALNALLLLPVRSSMVAGSLALLGVVYALSVISRMTRANSALKTGEGRFALATLFIPLGIILFRSTYFYQIDSLMIAMISTVVFLVMRQVSMFPGRSAGLAFFLDTLSWPVAFVVAVSFSIAIGDGLGNGLDFGVLAVAFSTLYAALAFDVMRRAISKTLTRAVGNSISLLVAASFLGSVLLAPTALNALLSITAGLLLLVWGASTHHRLSAFAGAITIGLAALVGLESIIDLILTRSWVDLAIFGASAIALGSILDRHGVTIKVRIEQWYRGALEWQ